MKFFVTGVGGQLGHDVMNELLKRGHEGVGSDIQENYSGVADSSAVTKAPYVALDITDKDAVEKVITDVNPVCHWGGKTGCGDPLCSMDCCGHGRG